MLIAQPKGLFSRNVTIREEGGSEVAELVISMLKEGAVLHHEGKTYRIERTGFMNGPWQLKDGDTVVFEANKPSMMRNRFTTVVKNAPLELSVKNMWMREFILVGPDWVDLGSIRRVSFWSRRVEVKLSELVPVLAQLFFLFQAMVIWKRADGAAGGGGAA